LGKPISEKSRRQSLSFSQPFDFGGDGLNGVLDIPESLFEPILPVLAGDEGLLMRANQPARPREGCRPNDRGCRDEKSHSHKRVRV
jgi:hypothetical protein